MLTLSADKTNLDFFELLFPAILFEQLARETNRYADQCQQKPGKADKQWVDKLSPMEIQFPWHLHVGRAIAYLQEVLEFQ